MPDWLHRLQSYHTDAVQDPPNKHCNRTSSRQPHKIQVKSVLVRNVNTKLMVEMFVAFTIMTQLLDAKKKVAGITKVVFSLLREMAAT
jgi:hypothetical protein